MKIDRKAIGGRIKDALITAGYGQADLARRLGIKDPSVSAYISGKSAISDKAYLIASEMTGKSIDYFFTGKDSNSLVCETKEDYGVVTMPVRATAGAGYPNCIESLEPIGQITVQRNYDGPNIQVLKVRGNSMEPTIIDGAYIGIDITDKHIISGQLYAVYIPHEGIVVKRIWMGPELVKLESDNKLAPTHDMSIDRIDWETFVQGKVKWVLQEY